MRTAVKSLFLLICLLVSGSAFTGPSAALSPGPGSFYLQNFNTQDCGGQGQNWALTQGPRGLIYVGNNEGVLEFDGVSWRIIRVDNFSIARSLATDPRQGRIFVGAQDEIGFLEPDETGMLHYRSLIEQVPLDDRGFSDVWRTVATDRGIYFSTRQRLFRWSGDGTMRVWRTDSHFRRGWNVNGTFFLSRGDTGLVFVGEHDRLQPVPGGDRFVDMRVNAVLPFAGDRLLVATREQGLFMQDGDRFVPFPTAADAYLKENLLTDAALLTDGSVALATMQGGIAITGPQGQLLGIVDQASGLRSNLVSYLATDHGGGLWAALGDGAARIEAPSPLTVHDAHRGVRGPVYAIARHEEFLYLGSSSGIFVSAGEGAGGESFRQLPGVSVQCFAFLSTELGLLAGTNAGIYLVAPPAPAALIPDTEGIYCFCRSQHDPGLVIVGRHGGLSLLTRSAGRWMCRRQLEGISENIRSVVDADASTWWLGTDFEGVLRVRFADGIDAPPTSIERFGVEQGLPERWSRIFRLDGEVVIGTEKGLFRPEEDGPDTRFVPDARFGTAFADGTTPVYHLATGAGEDPWLMSGNDVGLVSGSSGDSPAWETAPLHRMAPGETYTIFVDHDGILWVGRNNGLVRFDPHQEKSYTPRFNALVRRVFATRSETLVHGGFSGSAGTTPPRLSSDDRDLRFEFAAPLLDDVSRNSFRFFLEGYDEGWSDWTAETIKNYTNLPGGNYTVRVQAMNVYGNIGGEGVLAFEIERRWFTTWWATALLGLAAALVIYGLGMGLNRYRLRRLERRVNRRTAQLAKTVEELREANVRAEAASRAKSDFLAMISHEIRTPMTGVIGMAEMLLRTPLTTQQRESAGTIRVSGDVMLTILNDLLDFSKIQAGRLELQEHRFDLRQCFEEAVEVMALKAAEQGLELVCVLPADLPRTVRGDSTRLRQIVINLTSNAVKFTDRGEVCIAVEAGSLEGGGLEIRFAVRDTGMGISAEESAALFKPFSQVDSSATRRHGGTGLGLAITRRLCELMDGTIRLESEPGAGTTFHVKLKMQRPAEDAPESDAGPLDGSRLLIVEGNDCSRRALSMQARFLGGEPVAVASGAEAIRALQDDPSITVVLASLDLPDSDGLTLAGAIAGRTAPGPPPVILLVPKGRVLDSGDSPVTPTLSKPVRHEQLWRTILGAPDTRPAPPGDAAEQRAPLRVLLAEDDPRVRKTVVRMLGYMGHKPDVVDNGSAVLESLDEQEYDLILMDVRMPGMDGLEATRRIRAQMPPSRQPRIIALTASAGEEDREACLAAGMDSYLSKPMLFEELEEMLRQFDGPPAD